MQGGTKLLCGDEASVWTRTRREPRKSERTKSRRYPRHQAKHMQTFAKVTADNYSTTTHACHPAKPAKHTTTNLRCADVSQSVDLLVDSKRAVKALQRRVVLHERRHVRVVARRAVEMELGFPRVHLPLPGWEVTRFEDLQRLPMAAWSHRTKHEASS